MTRRSLWMRCMPITLAALLPACTGEAPAGVDAVDGLGPGARPPAVAERSDTVVAHDGAEAYFELPPGVADAATTLRVTQASAKLAATVHGRRITVRRRGGPDEAPDSLRYEAHGENGAVRGWLYVLAHRATAADSMFCVTGAPAPRAFDFVSAAELDDPRLAQVRMLAERILHDYGSPATQLGRARALRDWVARTAVHPFSSLHPRGSTANAMVLPPGTDWGEVNDLPDARILADNHWWAAVGGAGIEMLDSLVGLPDPATGQPRPGALMAHVQGAQYRMRDLASYRTVLCTWQVTMLRALWRSIGLHGQMVSMVGHDAAAVFLPELGRWVYMDPTFNEEYVRAPAEPPLGPVALFEAMQRGEATTLVPRVAVRPRWDPERYATGRRSAQATFLVRSAVGMPIIGTQARVGGAGVALQADVPALAGYYPFNDPSLYRRVPLDALFPDLGVGIASVRRTGRDGARVTVFTNQHGAVRLERATVHAGWTPVPFEHELTQAALWTESVVRYRSVDRQGHVTAEATLRFGTACGEG